MIMHHRPRGDVAKLAHSPMRPTPTHLSSNSPSQTVAQSRWTLPKLLRSHSMRRCALIAAFILALLFVFIALPLYNYYSAATNVSLLKAEAESPPESESQSESQSESAAVAAVECSGDDLSITMPSLIVIGEMKTATSTLFYLMDDKSKFPELRGPTVGYETQFFTWTMQRNFDASWRKINSDEFSNAKYRQKWNGITESEIRSKHLKLFEKSPPYALLPHLPQYIATKFVPCHGTKSLLLLRHPIKRLWSQFWHQNEVKSRFSEQFLALLSDDRYTARFRAMRDTLLSVKSGDISIDSELVTGQWSKLMFEDECCDFGKDWNYFGFCCQFDILVRSCYYPSVLHWSTQLPPNHFRIVSYEMMTRDWGAVVQQIRCWLSDDLNRDYIDESCQSLHPYQALEPKTKHMRATKGREIPNDVMQILKEWFAPCDDLLWEYLSAHPSLILGQNNDINALWERVTPP